MTIFLNWLLEKYMSREAIYEYYWECLTSPGMDQVCCVGTHYSYPSPSAWPLYHWGWKVNSYISQAPLLPVFQTSHEIWKVKCRWRPILFLQQWQVLAELSFCCGQTSHPTFLWPASRIWGNCKIGSSSSTSGCWQWFPDLRFRATGL